MHARDICEITEQPSSTVSRGVASLERRGLIYRTRDAVDSRHQVLNITEHGQGVHDAVLVRFQEAEASLPANLSEEERQNLLKTLDKIARSVGEWKT